MDRELKQLEKDLALYDKARGVEWLDAVSSATGPRYVRDLERRAALTGMTAEQVYQQDQKVLSGARPTENCLRAEQIMVAARDPNALRAEASAHLQDCTYCRSMVAAARPDVSRHRELVAAMASPGPAAQRVARRKVGHSQVASRTENAFRFLDRWFSKVIHFGLPAVAGCYLLFAAVVPWVTRSGAMIAERKEERRESDSRLMVPEGSADPGMHAQNKDELAGFNAAVSGEGFPIDPSAWHGVKFGALAKEDSGRVEFKVQGDATALPTDIGRVLFVVYAPTGSEQAAEAKWPLIERMLAWTANRQPGPIWTDIQSGHAELVGDAAGEVYDRSFDALDAANSALPHPSQAADAPSHSSPAADATGRARQ